MGFLKIIILCSLVTYSSTLSISSTKFPPITPTIKSLIATVPPILSQIRNEAINEKFGQICSLIAKIGLMLYSCLSITILCDTYFVPSLEFIGESLSLPNDITGALFTPLGTAGPEVFSSLVGVFVTDSNIGTGAIIGSAVFNLLIIPSACAFTAIYFGEKALKLNPITIVRDLILYIISIIALILVIQDNKVELVEAMMLCLLFILFVIFLYYNSKLMEKLKKLKTLKKASIETKNCSCSGPECDQSCDNSKINEKSPLISKDKPKTFSIQISSFTDISYEIINKFENNNNDLTSIDIKLDDYEEDNGICSKGFIHLLSLPIRFIMYLTIPKPSKKYFVITFIFCIGWLALLSYITVTSVQFLSDYLSISDTVAGMTLLAVGSAVPDLVTSIIFVKKKGLADMAICGAIASNRFAILIGLGFPWIIKCIVNWIENNSFKLNSISIYSNSLPYTSLVLLTAIVLLFVNFRFNNWTLNCKFAITCIVIHAVFVATAIYLDYKA